MAPPAHSGPVVEDCGLEAPTLAVRERRREAPDLVGLCERALLGELPPTQRMVGVLRRVLEHLAAERAAVLMLDDDSRLRVVASLGLEDTDCACSLEVGDGLSGYVARTGEPLLVRCVERDDRFRHRRHERYMRGSLISVPVVHAGAVRGAMSICRARGPFRRDDLSVLAKIALAISTAAGLALP